MSTADILTHAWVADAAESLLEDPGFSQRQASFVGTIAVRETGQTGHALTFADGKAHVVDGEGVEADFVLEGTREQWQAALAYARDIGAAQGVGLTLRGTWSALSGNAVVLSRIWLALQGSLPEPPVSAAERFETPRDAPEIIGRYLDVDGYRMYYEEAGSGRPVVCIHSGGADGRQYRHLLQFLAARGYRAIALDLPGHGKSYPDLETRKVLSTIDEWVAFVLAAASRLRLEWPVFVGCAMSASLLLELAAEHPDAARAIVSTGGTVDFTSSLNDAFLNALNHPQVNASDFLEAVTPGLIGRNLELTARNEAIWQNARGLTPEVMDADLRAYSTHNVSGRLHQIVVPVLHLRSSDDGSVTDADIDALRENVPSISLQTLEGVGHLPMVENPDLYNRTVAEFLAALDD